MLRAGKDAALGLRNVMAPEENDLLCRVEGDAPMGQIMRRHWIAACLSEEVAERDGPPMRVRLPR